MASERPEPAHTPDSAPSGAPVTEAAPTGVGDVSPEDAAEFTAALEARRSLSQALREVLSLPAVGVATKRCSFAQLQDPDHLMRLFERWHRKKAGLYEAATIGLVIKVLERGPQAVTAFREICDRLEGTVAQRLQVEGQLNVRELIGTAYRDAFVPRPEITH